MRDFSYKFLSLRLSSSQYYSVISPLPPALPVNIILSLDIFIVLYFAKFVSCSFNSRFLVTPDRWNGRLMKQLSLLREICRKSVTCIREREREKSGHFRNSLTNMYLVGFTLVIQFRHLHGLFTALQGTPSVTLMHKVAHHPISHARCQMHRKTRNLQQITLTRILVECIRCAPRVNFVAVLV